MATAGRPQKISIGFAGTQVLAARVTSEELDRLRRSLGAPDAGWHELTAEDGTIVLDLGKVAYLLVEHEEHRVGFGA